METEVHHDPQYEHDQDLEATPIPLHYSLMAIIGCAVIVGESALPFCFGWSYLTQPFKIQSQAYLLLRFSQRVATTRLTSATNLTRTKQIS